MKEIVVKLLCNYCTQMFHNDVYHLIADMSITNDSIVKLYPIAKRLEDFVCGLQQFFFD